MDRLSMIKSIEDRPDDPLTNNDYDPTMNDERRVGWSRTQDIHWILEVPDQSSQKT